MLNFFLFVLLLCLAAFFVNLYFQLSRIENTLKSHLEKIEVYLSEVYGSAKVEARGPKENES